MKHFVLTSLLAIGLGGAHAQQDVRASWIEAEKTGNQLQLRLYQQFAEPENLAAQKSIEEYVFHAGTGSWSLNRSLQLSTGQSFATKQNLYYPNCGNWIGALPCREIQIHRYNASFALPAGSDTLRLRYVHRLTNLPVMDNLGHTDSTIDALCFTDFHFLRNSNSNNFTPKLVFTEDWHRYFPIVWTNAQPGEAFINAYIPFEFTTNSPRGSNFSPFYTSFSPETNSLSSATAFIPAGNDTSIFLFARQFQPFQVGIRSTETRNFRLATPLTLWNKLSSVDSNLTYVYWVAETEAALASSVFDMDDDSPVVGIEVFDLLGRRLYAGESLNGFVWPSKQLLVVVESLASGKQRSKKWLNIH